MSVRVEECGESECRSCNGPDGDRDIIPRKSEPTSAESFFMRLFTELLQEEK